MTLDEDQTIRKDSSKIALLWSNPYAYEIANMLMKRYHLLCSCELTTLENIGDAAAVRVANGAKIIVSRGDGARHRIQEKVSVPVVSVRYNFSDFATAIDTALKYGKRIAMVVFTQDLFEVVKRENFFWHIQTTLIHVRDKATARVEIQKLIQEGTDVIIGGATTKEVAQEFDVPVVLIKANEHAILEAIEEAVRSLRILEETELQYQTILRVVESASHGMMTVDHNGIVTNINHAARKLLDLTKDVIGQPYYNVVPFSDVVAHTLTGTHYNNYLFEYHNSYLILNSLPILLEGIPQGIVMNIQGGEEVQTIENKLRKRVSGTGQIAKYSFQDIIGTSPQISQAKQWAATYAGVDSTVLILGDSGTGKELFAQSIHNASPRRRAPFVAVNCAAFPEHLLESELFGYVKGAFTGANAEGKSGIFEQAHKGTIFLDEIGEMPLSLQSRLLRVIQEREVTRIGSQNVIPVDIRIIAATNRDLFAEVKAGNFRKDLYYRLNVLTLKLPSLQERKEDIPLLASHFIKDFNEKYGRSISGILPEAEEVLLSHSYYGNIRELSNVIERAVILSGNPMITLSDLSNAFSDQMGEKHNQPESSDLPTRAERFPFSERSRIVRALEESGFNQMQAAQLLGISRTTLWRKLKKYHLNLPGSKNDYSHTRKP